MATIQIGKPPALPLERVQNRIPAVEERYTPELVLAFVGPVGSGVSTSAQIMSAILLSDFGYTGNVLKISDLINENSDLVSEESIRSDDPKRTENLQRVGTKLRKERGPSYLSELAVAKINLSRVSNPDAEGKPSRRFTIIDSIKHPEEVAKLQHVYGHAFWLVGIFAPEEKRRERLSSVIHESQEVAQVMSVDEDEKEKTGQKVRDTMFLSDYFIRNDADNDDVLRVSIRRFLDVIFGINVQTPTRDESAMYAAASAAAKGACLSRQVGAVIVNKQGELIGTGNNDVPKSGGGLYSFEDGKLDNRCYKWKTKRCHNDKEKNDLKNEIVNALLERGIVRADKREEAESIIFSAGLKNLIEFSRAVHAEMEAIISVARSGSQGIKGSTLYSTTYPCHSCARHIVAAGVERVIYIEPYAKSLATSLHSDSISTLDSDKKKVTFLQYEGMAPKNLLRIFRNGIVRKAADGKALIRARKEAAPILREHVDDFARREKLVAGALAGAQKETVGESQGGAVDE